MAHEEEDEDAEAAVVEADDEEAVAAVVVFISRNGVVEAPPPLFRVGLLRMELELAVDVVVGALRLLLSRSLFTLPDELDVNELADPPPPPPPPSPWLLCGMLRFGVMTKPVGLSE